jgi:hypothetical protein
MVYQGRIPAVSDSLVFPRTTLLRASILRGKRHLFRNVPGPEGSPYGCLEKIADASGFGLDFILGCKYATMYPKTFGIQSERTTTDNRRLDCIPAFWAVGKALCWCNPKMQLDPDFRIPVGMLYSIFAEACSLGIHSS